MKTHLFPFLLLTLFLTACAPRIAYMGDSYSPTYDVDVYYDEKDIEKEYKVMGIARNEGDELERDDLNSIKEQMIKKAREVGADGILFISVGQNTGSADFDSNKIVEAKFLSYRSKTN